MVERDAEGAKTGESAAKGTPVQSPSLAGSPAPTALSQSSFAASVVAANAAGGAFTTPATSGSPGTPCPVGEGESAINADGLHASSGVAPANAEENASGEAARKAEDAPEDQAAAASEVRECSSGGSPAVITSAASQTLGQVPTTEETYRYLTNSGCSRASAERLRACIVRIWVMYGNLETWTSVPRRKQK